LRGWLKRDVAIVRPHHDLHADLHAGAVRHVPVEVVRHIAVANGSAGVFALVGLLDEDVRTLQGHEKEMIEAALTESKRKVAGANGAAAKLGVPASTLESKIKQLK